MLDKLAAINARYLDLERLIADPETLNDYERMVAYNKERASLVEIVEVYHQLIRQNEELEQARVMIDTERDPELRAMAQEEVADLEASLNALRDQLKLMLIPKDPRDSKNVIVEIRAGAGGDEAGLFAADLFRMYSYYAEARRWKVEVIDQSDTGVGGFKEISFEIRGEGAFSRLKYESGVHRVQRVPDTESQGRIHTSTVTVAVLAQMDEVDVDLDMSDVRVDVYRASGAGGQHVNKTSSAIRMTHEPTGIVVAVQDERSQQQNRVRAKQILVARLYELAVEQARLVQDSERRSQVGTGDRSEKIRTYNYPQNRVSDHRINITSYNLPAVMEGALDDFIDELIARDQAEKLAAGGEGSAQVI